MKITIILLFTLFQITFNLNAQDVSKKELKYKPSNLSESITQLNKTLNDSTKNDIRNMSEKEFLGNSHLGLGMWVRNNWNLWKGSKLSKYFNELGIHHPDDMSRIILTSYYRDLKSEPIELNNQITFYQKYWNDLSEHKERLESDTTYAIDFNKKLEENEIKYYDSLKKNFVIKDTIATYLINSCGFFGSYKKTKIEGKIIDLGKEDKILIEIMKTLDPKTDKDIFKCNEIKDNKIWINIEDVEKI